MCLLIMAFGRPGGPRGVLSFAHLSDLLLSVYGIPLALALGCLVMYAAVRGVEQPSCWDTICLCLQAIGVSLTIALMISDSDLWLFIVALLGIPLTVVLPASFLYFVVRLFLPKKPRGNFWPRFGIGLAIYTAFAFPAAVIALLTA